ncbi:MAG TPA: ParB/RepB/Spo0J family partition protein [Gemmataceae bacterium]|nr:ParB/RepB/Spo0J family partition protein [Gemmataceae bacterium]
MRNGTPNIIHVPPAEVLPPETDLREGRDPEHVGNLAAAMQKEGFTGTVLGRRVPVGVQCIWGWTRCLASIQARLATIPVQLVERELTQSDILMLQLDEQELRVDFTPLEVARGYQELMRLNGWTQAEVATRRRKSRAHVAKVLAISTKLPAEVQAMVAAGELAPRAAYALSHLADIPTVVDLAKKARDLPMAVETVEEKVRGLLGNGRKVKARPLKLKGDGVQMVVSNPTVDAVQSFAERLLAALRKLVKDGDGIEFLPSRLKGTS